MTGEVWPARGSMSRAPCNGLGGVSSPRGWAISSSPVPVLRHLQLRLDCWPCLCLLCLSLLAPPVEIFPVEGWSPWLFLWNSCVLHPGHDMIDYRRKCPQEVPSPLTIGMFRLSAFNKTLALNHLTWIQELNSSSFRLALLQSSMTALPQPLC